MAKESIGEFLDIYRREECLWNIKKPSYRDKKAKHFAYEKLALKLKEVDRGATRETVVKKINSLRSSYRKEVKKVMESKKTAKHPTDIYKPALWYFDKLSFLRGREEQSILSSLDTMDTDTTNDFSNNCYESDSNHEMPSSPPEIKEHLRPPSPDDEAYPNHFASIDIVDNPMLYRSANEVLKGKINDTMNHTIENNSSFASNKEDRFDVFGKNVAMKLRDLSTMQRIMAEKLINDCLYEAEMENLDRNWKLVNEKNT